MKTRYGMSIDDIFVNLKNTISHYDADHQQMLTEWLQAWNRYLQAE